MTIDSTEIIIPQSFADFLRIDPPVGETLQIEFDLGKIVDKKKLGSINNTNEILQKLGLSRHILVSDLFSNDFGKKFVSKIENQKALQKFMKQLNVNYGTTIGDVIDKFLNITEPDDFKFVSNLTIAATFD